MCLTVQSGDSLEPRKKWREKKREREPIPLEERRTALLRWRRSEGEICPTKEKTPFRGVQRRNSSTDGDVRDAPAWKCLWRSAGGKLKDFCFKWWIKGFYTLRVLQHLQEENIKHRFGKINKRSIYFNIYCCSTFFQQRDDIWAHQPPSLWSLWTAVGNVYLSFLWLCFAVGEKKCVMALIFVPSISHVVHSYPHFHVRHLATVSLGL